MRKFFFQLHLWASVIISPIVLVFAITGSLMAFEPELDHALHASLTYVNPDGKTLPLAALRDISLKTFTKDTVQGYELSTSPGISWRVNTNNRTVYFDQYTGKILGTMTGPDFWQTAQQDIHSFHLRLAFSNRGTIGKSVVAWAAVVLLIILPSGIVLWWKQKRFAIKKGNNSRLIWFDWHNLIGMLAVIPLLVLALTGVAMGFENQTGPLFYKLTNSKPVDMPDTKIIAPAGAKAISPDSIVSLARTTIPGAAPFNLIYFSPNDAWMVLSRFPEDRTPGGRSRILINPYTAKVIWAQGSRTAPAGRRIQNMIRAIHTGDVFGLLSKTIMCLASLALGFQLISGLRMWWLRKWRKKRTPTSRV